MRTLSEKDWFHPTCLKWQQELASRRGPVKVEFTDLEWIDLWPLCQLVKVLHARLAHDGLPVRIELPMWSRSDRQINRANRPLCFLVDIGFVALAHSWGASVRIGANQQKLVPSDDTTCGLAQENLEQLRIHGYWSRDYKDKIMLPLRMVSSHLAVDTLREHLSRYVSNYLKYYEREIAEANLIDTFFRELTENTVEHSDKSAAFVAARLIRSVWDMGDTTKRQQILAARLRGKLEPMRRFIKSHEDDGFVELVVVDSGKGIKGTLEGLAPPDQRVAPEIYRFAMRSDVSQTSEEARLRSGKSPLTGLGECANRLEHAPAVLVIREASSGCVVAADRGVPGRGPALRFKNLPPRAGERTIGCNIQLAIAIKARSNRGTRLELKESDDSPMGYAVLSDSFEPQMNTVRSETELTGVVIVGEGRRQGWIVDLTAVPGDKDSAWHVAHRLMRDDLLEVRPIILVGVEQAMSTHLAGALQHLRQSEPGLADDTRGWLTVNAQREWAFVGGDPQLAAYVLEGIARRWFAGSPHEYFKMAVHQLRLCDSRGLPTVQFGGVFSAWRRGIGAWVIKQAANRQGIVREDWVALPNGTVVSNYLDIGRLLREEWSRRALLNCAEVAVLGVSPRVIVTYSSGGRQFCSQLLRLIAGDIAHLELSDPYSPAGGISGVAQFAGQPTLVIGDATFTGRHAARIVRGCDALGLDVRNFVAILDSHPSGSETPNVSVPFKSLLRYPFEELDGQRVAASRIDPYTLSVRPVSAVAKAQVFRTETQGAEFYNFAAQQKAILAGHSVNASGRHFVVSVDVRQFVRPDALNYLIQKLAPFTRKCAAIVFPEESVIGTVAHQVARKLGIPADRVVPAIPSKRISREYAFTTEGEAALHATASAKGTLLFLDDATHSGRVLSRVAAAVAAQGIEKIQAWFVINNAPPGNVAVGTIVESGGRPTTINSSWMLRSFFPVYASAARCPYCRIGQELKQAMMPNAHVLLSNYSKQRLDDLTPVNSRTAVLDPWRRHLTMQPIRVPETAVQTGLPDVVRSSETLEVCLLELSQFEEGILALTEQFRSRVMVGHEALLAMILGTHIPTLDKLGVRSEFVRTFWAVVAEASGDNGARVLETALLWPADVLVDEAPMLTDLLKADLVTSDAGAATLFSVLRKAMSVDARSRELVERHLAKVRLDFPAKAQRRGIAIPIIGALLEHSSQSESLRWALLRLAQRVLVHREPHHRILDQIGSLAATLDVKHVDAILGVQSDALAAEYMSMMMGLGDIERALSTLIDLGELSGGGTTGRLQDAIRSLLDNRSTLRQLHLSGKRDGAAKTIELCDSIRSRLLEIDILLRSPDPQERASEIFVLLEERLLDPVTRILEPIERALDAVEVVQRAERKERNGNVEWPRVLADPVFVALLVKGIRDNVQKHSTKGEMFIRVTVTHELRGSDRWVVIITNPTHDKDAAEKFADGRDRRSLALELSKYGGECRGYLAGGVFHTEISLQAV